MSQFRQFQQTYGSLGAVIGFMTWIWLSTIVVLVGGKLNAEIERSVREARGKKRRAGDPPAFCTIFVFVQSTIIDLTKGPFRSLRIVSRDNEIHPELPDRPTHFPCMTVCQDDLE
jgi:Virulence factor BrkB